MRDPRGLDSPWEARTNMAGEDYAALDAASATASAQPVTVTLGALTVTVDADTARWSDEPPAPRDHREAAAPSPAQAAFLRQRAFLSGVNWMLDRQRIYGRERQATVEEAEAIALVYFPEPVRAA